VYLDIFFSPDGPFVEKLGTVQILLQKGSAAIARTNVTDTEYYILTLGYMTEVVYDLVAVVVLCLVLLCLSAVLLIFVTQAVTSWFFGWTRLSTGFLIELAIEPLPFGEHSLVHIDWTAGSIGLDGIVHSWTYAHPTAIRHLQDWVKASLAEHRPSSAKNPEPQTLQSTDPV
jgi:hypothetical protein